MYKWITRKYSPIVDQEENDESKYIKMCQHILQSRNCETVTDYPGQSFGFDLSEGQVPWFSTTNTTWYTILNKSLQFVSKLKYNLPHDIVVQDGNFIHITSIRGDLWLHYHCSSCSLIDIPQVITEIAVVAHIIAHLNNLRMRDITTSFDYITYKCKNERKVQQSANSVAVLNYPRLVIKKLYPSKNNLTMDDFQLMHYRVEH